MSLHYALVFSHVEYRPSRTSPSASLFPAVGRSSAYVLVWEASPGRVSGGACVQHVKLSDGRTVLRPSNVPSTFSSDAIFYARAPGPWADGEMHCLCVQLRDHPCVSAGSKDASNGLWIMPLLACIDHLGVSSSASSSDARSRRSSPGTGLLQWCCQSPSLSQLTLGSILPDVRVVLGAAITESSGLRHHMRLNIIVMGSTVRAARASRPLTKADASSFSTS